MTHVRGQHRLAFDTAPGAVILRMVIDVGGRSQMKRPCCGWKPVLRENN